MPVISEFRIRSPGLALNQAQEAYPDVTLTVIQEVATDPQRPYMLVWVSGVDPGDFEAAMIEDPTVSQVERYSEADGKVLFRMRVNDCVDFVMYPLWVRFGAEPLDVEWSDGWWRNRMRFPDRETLSTFRRRTEEAGVEFVLDGVYRDEKASDGSHSLSEEQRAALQTAFEVGYFDIPRSSSLADVADELGLSSQAVSERLRRGQKRLVAEHLR